MNFFQRLWNKLWGIEEKQQKPKPVPVEVPVTPKPSEPGKPEPKPVEPSEPSGKRYLDKNGKLITNQEGLELTKHFEGLFLKAYLDPVGVPTIAYGRIVYPNGKKVRMGDTCTEAEADAWLLEDMYGEGAKYVRAFLNDAVEGTLNDNEMSALTGFTFNRGAGRFRDIVAPHLNRGDKKAAVTALLSVNYAGGGYLLGLDRRRWAEKMLFEGKDWRAFDTVAKFQKFKNAGYRA
jgi:lysozyme